MQDQEQRLQQEILSDAERKAEHIVQRARHDIEKLQKRATSRIDRARKARLEEAETTAASRCRAVRVSIRQEQRRRRLLAREDALADLFGSVLNQLTNGDGFDRTESLVQLLEEAVSSIGPEDVTVQVAPGAEALLTQGCVDAAVRRALPDAVRQPTVSVTASPDVDGGLILTTLDGRKRFDNTYATRLERLRSALVEAVCREAPEDSDTDKGSNDAGA